MKRPALGPKTKADRKKAAAKLWYERKRAEKRHNARGGESDSNYDSDDERPPDQDPDQILPDQDPSRVQGANSGKHSTRRKRLRNSGSGRESTPRKRQRRGEPATQRPRKNLERVASEDARMAELLRDPDLSGKDDSEFDSDNTLSDIIESDGINEVDSPPEDPVRCASSQSLSESERSSNDSEVDPTESGSEGSDDLDDEVANPFLIPPSRPIRYDQVDESQDPSIELLRAITAVKVRHVVSDAAIDDLLKVVITRREIFLKMVEEKRLGGSYRKNVRQKVMKGLPKMTCGVLIEDSSTDPPTCTYQGGLKTIPAHLWKSRLPGNQKYIKTIRVLGSTPKMFSHRLLRQDVTTSIAEIKEFHKRVCMSQEKTEEQFKRDCQNIDISVDGVQETRHGKRKFTFVTVKLGGVGYTLKVFNPLVKTPGAKISTETLIGDLLQDIEDDEDLKLSFIIADTPERHALKGMQSHAGKYSCETCTARAETKPSTFWPERTMKAAIRTEEGMKNAALNLHDRKYNHKGINAYSPLHDIGDGFSIIWNVPTEEFHLCKEGMAKAVIKRLFEDANTKISREVMERWTETYEATRVFSETARRPRPISTGVMKGTEYGVLLFSGFPVLVSILDEFQIDHWKYAQTCIALITFLSKAYNLDNDKLATLQRVLRLTGLSLRYLHNVYYRTFMKGLCKQTGQRPTCNTHAFYHLHQQRLKSKAPLHRTSAEPFEAMYAVIRRSFKAGTRNTPLQAMENGYLRILHTSFHGRKRHLVVREASESKSVRDSMVVTDRGLFEVFGQEENPWNAYPIKVSPFQPNMELNLPWSSVGVHVYNGHDYSQQVQIRREEITGKAMLTGGLLIEWKSEMMLMSKADD